jgi:hypothetical protein
MTSGEFHMSNRTHSHYRALRYKSVRKFWFMSAVAALVGASSAHAQFDASQSRGTGFTLRPVVGVYIPTGDQRDALRDAFHLGAQASYPILPRLSVVGAVAWSASQRRDAPDNATTNVFHYDAGVEGYAAERRKNSGWYLSPFAGLGLGGRTYRARRGDEGDQTRFTGYGALGAEATKRRFGIRFEARDYLSKSGPTRTQEKSGTRNDVTLALGTTIRF